MARVRLVWIINPSALSVHVLDAGNPSFIGRLQGSDPLKGEPVLSGVDLAMLFGEGQSE
jgi:hypothetical protein